MNIKYSSASYANEDSFNFINTFEGGFTLTKQMSVLEKNSFYFVVFLFFFEDTFFDK